MQIGRIGLINIGGNLNDGPARGPIFADGSFKYIPIPQGNTGAKMDPRYPTYRELGLISYLDPSYHDHPVHHDPNFVDMTYGHEKRGFGYETILLALEKGDILAFYATLSYKDKPGIQPEWIDLEWGTYIIGAFRIENIYRPEEYRKLPSQIKIQFKKNPHALGDKEEADLWIAGSNKSPGLFPKAFPLHQPKNRLRGNNFLKSNFKTSGGKTAGEAGYYRHAFLCEDNVLRIWDFILDNSHDTTVPRHA